MNEYRLEGNVMQATGPIVSGEQFAPGYTVEAAEYEQRTRLQAIPFASYALAEREAILFAGDTEKSMAVVEDFAGGQFLVMTEAAAEDFVTTHDAEIQYRARFPGNA